MGAAGGEGDGAVWDVGVFERASVEAGCGECEGGGQRGALVSEWGGGYEVELLSGGSGDGISGAGAGGGLGVGGVGWGFPEGGEGVGASVVCGGEMASGEEGGASAVFEEHVPGAADAGTAGDGNLCAEGGGLGSDARAGVL